MNICIKRSERGFTIVEMMVVISIVVILLSIVFASIAQARQGSRDKKRISDLANIELALTIEREKSRNYPAYASGAEINLSTTGISKIISDRGGNAYVDPSSTGTGSSYGYWYDSDFTCAETGQVVIYAQSMEKSGGGNFTTKCIAATTADKETYANRYIVVLD